MKKHVIYSLDINWFWYLLPTDIMETKYRIFIEIPKCRKINFIYLTMIAARLPLNYHALIAN